ncbi:MAG: hypothetical protein KDH98_18775 [Calditrichaeota bacterium]|nr:hypothetical protein [Calditrichota bacterium]
MSDIKITGHGNVVGSNNMVITKINEKFQNNDRKELGELFALLKSEIKQLSLSDKSKNQSIRAIEDAEEEASEESTNVETIQKSLNRMKDVLEDSGEVYDNAKSWGKRLSELSQLLVKYFPQLINWANTLSN